MVLSCLKPDPVPCQTQIIDLGPCNKAGEYEINPEIEKFCPCCLPKRGKQVELRLEFDDQRQKDELHCDVCGFRCWNRNYPHYRGAVQQFVRKSEVRAGYPL